MSVRYIETETPTWTINWVNTTFLTVNNIDKIWNLIVDGVSTNNYTKSGNVIIIWFAPTSDIWVWYYPLIWTHNTLQQIMDRVYKLIEENSSNIQYDTTYITSLINEVQEDIIRWQIVSIVDNIVIRPWDLRFMDRKYFIDYVEPKTISLDIALTDTTISVDTTDMNSYWYVVIDQDVIQYTWKTSNTLTWVTGISTTHTTWTVLRQVYKIPTTAWKWYKLEVLWDYITERYISYMDYKMRKDKYNYFTIIWDDESSDWMYIDIVLNSWWLWNNNKLCFYYVEQPTDMVSNTDYTELPWKKWLTVIAPLVAGRALFYSDEQEKALWYLKEWYNALQTMYNQYTDRYNEQQKQIKMNMPRYNRRNRIDDKFYFTAE